MSNPDDLADVELDAIGIVGKHESRFHPSLYPLFDQLVQKGYMLREYHEYPYFRGRGQYAEYPARDNDPRWLGRHNLIGSDYELTNRGALVCIALKLQLKDYQPERVSYLKPPAKPTATPVVGPLSSQIHSAAKTEPEASRESIRPDVVSEPERLRERRAFIENRLAQLRRQLDVETSKRYSSSKYEEGRIKDAIESFSSELAELNGHHPPEPRESESKAPPPRSLGDNERPRWIAREPSARVRAEDRYGQDREETERVRSAQYEQRRLGIRSFFSRMKQIRLKKIYVYLMMSASIFGLGVYLVPSLDIIELAFISLFNGLVIFVVAYGIAGITRRGVGHKLFAVILILIVIGFLYQNPLLAKPAVASKELIQSEGSYISALGNPVYNSNPNSGNMLGALGGFLNGVSSSLGSLGKGLISPGQTSINSLWVKDFLGNVSVMGGVPTMTVNSQLDQLAQERFSTMIQQPDVTHYGADSEIPPGVGEVVYYPTGQTPSAYANDIKTTAPLHWDLMVSGFRYYGYYSGSGPTYEVNQGCPNTELPGPNINVTQFFQQEGCQVSKVTATWLVIDFS